MKKEQFRKSLEEALERKDLGIVLWPMPEFQKENANKLLPGGYFYEDTLMLMKAGIMVRHLAELFPNSVRIIVFPVSKVLDNEEMFNEAYHYANLYLGPITAFPSGDVIPII